MASSSMESEHEEVPVLMTAEHAFARVVTAISEVGRVGDRDDAAYRVTGRVRAGGVLPTTVIAIVKPNDEDTALVRVEATGGSAAGAISRVLDAF